MRTPLMFARRLVVAASAAAAMVATMAVAIIPAAAEPTTPAVPATADEKFTDEAMSTLSAADSADFWIRFADRADLSAAAATADWDARGVAVHDALVQTAEAAQAGVVAELTAAGATFESHWISNAILVQGGSLDLARQAASSSEVLEIRQTTTYPAEEPVAGPTVETSSMGRNVLEWGISAINADDVWAEYGVTGEGITVANIDSGVQGDHPALAAHYRGLQADGTVDNNYNWFDVAGACDGSPCDTDGHGTHTMGTMIGSDGGANQIGVAPGADWIAANGCSTCADADLIASGEWVIAPTDSAGGNADPTKRPHIVNNSWGSRTPTNDPFMEDVIAAWEAAGIFGTWSNGNSGPSCSTSGSPGSRTLTYSVGAFDSGGNIASFSARGPGQDGTIKPNIAAPGANVRSSVPGDAYGTASGTSMAAPHLAGAIALLWSAAPSLIGDIAGTQALLDATATDVDDTTCGGTAEDNNVWGEGRLDALALVQAAPTAEAGTLTGTVTSSDGGPIAGATVTVTGENERVLTTDENGAFTGTFVAGAYTVTATAFGYASATADVTVVAEETVSVDLVLEAAASFAVSGTVTNEADGAPVAGATVAFTGAPIEPVTTGADGTYAVADVPAGTYTVTITGDRCSAPFSTELVVDGDETLDAALVGLQDDYGYFCSVGTDGYRQGDTLLALTGDDAAVAVELPFAFPFYGGSYSTAYVSTNGHVNFLAAITAYANAALPTAAAPNAAVYGFWDDLTFGNGGTAYTATTTIDGEDAFVIEYRDVSPFSSTDTVSFSITLFAGGDVEIGYGPASNAENPRLLGNSATVGIENESGTVASQYSFNEPVLATGSSVRYELPPNGTVFGNVTDFNDGLAVAGATVTATPDDGGEPRTVTTDANGDYNLLLFFGAYTVDIEAPGYTTRTRDVVINVDGERNRFSPQLKTGIATVAPPSYSWTLTEGQTRTADLTISNSGSAPLAYTIGELPRAVNEAAAVPALSTAALDAAVVPAGNTSLAQVNSAFAELEEAAAQTDPNARTALGLYTDGQRDQLAAPVTPDAVGDILAQWDSNLSGVAWGVGYTGDVWISDAEQVVNQQYSTAGTPGSQFPANWGGTWSGDLAQDSTTGDLCQVNVGGDNGIHCFEEATGAATTTLTGSPWSSISQRGLAYNAAEDVFYIGGWNEGIIYTVAGTTHATPGETLAQCTPEDPSIAGIAYNPTSNTIWYVNSALVTSFFQISPEDCSTITTVAYPVAGEGPGSGLDLDATGALWTANQLTGEVYLVDVGDPNVTDVPWLTVTPAEGTVRAGRSVTLDVTVDTTGLAPGVYGANILVQTNAGRVPTITVPVTLIVSAYQVGVNAGGGAYTDAAEFAWSADQPLSAGDWGWTGQRTETEATDLAIGGTTEDTLFQTRRTGIFSYVFTDAPAGTYAIDLGFAEFDADYPERDRLFDVLVNGEYALVAVDVAEEAGGLWADQHTVIVEHEGGDLEVEFANRRSYEYPILNTLAVTERGDL
ncbi:S8 family serine peptidase [Occultella kanbiaonis]|uniref:S8 family serine peptidase n=1 Tax=Occultella kanbiaonis TaxID=2675754 RepID=UPI0012B84070|nr:S8 family serine peptidase [Occultella kanbiaonis]